MDQKKLIVLAVVGVGAYLFMSRANAAAAGAQYRVPGVTATGAPRYPTAPSPVAASEAAMYQGLGGLLGKIAGRIGGGGSSAPTAAVALPDDSIAANPFGMTDPYAYEASVWGIDLENFSFASGL